jgi:proline iminopeptidase
MAAPAGAGLYHERVGSGGGIPILAMHGGLGWDHTYFRPYLDSLADLARLIYYDHRGNGRSEPPSSWNDVTHRSLVDDAEAIRRQLVDEPVVLFGHSYGGFLAQEFALMYPDSLRGLILCSTAPALDYADVALANARARGTGAQVDAVLSVMSKPVSDDASFRDICRTIMPLYFHDANGSLPRSLMERTEYSAAAYNHALFHCLAAFNTLDQLPRVATPTLVLCGASDWITPPHQGAERLSDAIPNSKMVLFDRSGHFPFAEEPALFVTVVREWLAELA